MDEYNRFKNKEFDADNFMEIYNRGNLLLLSIHRQNYQEKKEKNKRLK
jgi:hypothetical protein